jgi:hypothetical protein
VRDGVVRRKGKGCQGPDGWVGEESVESGIVPVGGPYGRWTEAAMRVGRSDVAVDVAPIGDSEITGVSVFLHEELDERLSPRDWADSIRVPWRVDAPNHGFLLRDGDRIVGVYLAFYSERPVRGGPSERFCNLGAWSVLPEYRAHSVRLLRALLAQPETHFTDLSPSGAVIPLNTRMRFRALDTTSALIPGLPWPSWPGRVSISSDPAVIERSVSESVRGIYRDHAGCAAARHVVITTGGGRSCYVMYRRVRRRNLPVFAAVLYVSDPDIFTRYAHRFGRYLMARRGVLATLAELRIVGDRPHLSVMLPSARPKMFRSDTLTSRDVDDLYSELPCVPW